ncbi:hypothetical protein [Vibrio sp. J502]|uniref:hypothetical protein n=1 Tax=Vibrio sp. J502 TaxID=2978741 RepID=UPI0021C20117|nr:hypothetical protein [Vibrio sp. J502]UXH28413.1 hypothetical protein N5E84_00450 [Vibrio sp. J502]
MLHPKVMGSVVVDDIVVKGDISPLDVTSGRVAMDFNGYQALLNAAIQTADGELSIHGDARTAENGAVARQPTCASR